MSNKLNEFIANIKTGMAKSTHFEVLITSPPALIVEPTNSNMRKILMFCDQAQLPGMSYETNQVRTYGETRDIPYSKLYEHINLSFYVDAAFLVKDFFDSWMEAIQDPITRNFNYATTYLAPSIVITAQDAQDVGRYSCTLYNAFPKSISAIQLDYAAKDVMKLQVSISYEYAKSEILASGIDTISIVSAQPSYEYGYTTIPNNYFSNFAQFQNTGVENMNELTGVGFGDLPTW